MLVVDAVANAIGARGHEIAAGHLHLGAPQMGAGDTLVESRFHLDAGTTDGFDHRRQCRQISDPAMGFHPGSDVAGLQAGVDLRAGAMHQHQPDAQAVQQHDILHQMGEIRVLHRFAAKRNDKGLIAVGVDVGRTVAEPFDVVLVVHGGTKGLL